MKPSRPVLRYYGGKWRLAPWVMSHFPPHRCYVEPFGGAASVLIRKERVPAEVYNDVDGHVVAFFRVLRERPQELIRAIELTPFAREEFELAADVDWCDDVESARRLYVRCHQGMHGGHRPNRTGWRLHRAIGRLTTAAHEFAGVEHLVAIAERFRGVQIEHDDAVAVIARYDTPQTLFYLDPPYPKHVRSHTAGRDGYVCELDDEGHERLLASIRDLAGMVALSGYRCDLYDTTLAGWSRVDRDVVTARNGTAVESLWLSPAASAALWPTGRLINRAREAQA